MLTKGKKVLYVICEGDSDRLTFHDALENYFVSRNISVSVHITKGDFAYDKQINERNCVQKIGDMFEKFRNANGLKYSDILAIVQLVDTDAAFVDPKLIKEDSRVKKYRFENNCIFVHGRKCTIKRFANKTAIYKKLIQTASLCRGKIKYHKFFFSRNLEHALYDRINCDPDEKMDLAEKFADKYKEDAAGFKKEMSGIRFGLPSDYEKSWEYIMSDNHSMERSSNFFIFFRLFPGEDK